MMPSKAQSPQLTNAYFQFTQQRVDYPTQFGNTRLDTLLPGTTFFLRIGLCTRHYQDLVSQERKSDRAVSTTKTSHLVLIQPNLSFGLFIGFLDPPSASYRSSNNTSLYLILILSISYLLILKYILLYYKIYISTLSLHISKRPLTQPKEQKFVRWWPLDAHGQRSTSRASGDGSAGDPVSLHPE